MDKATEVGSKGFHEQYKLEKEDWAGIESGPINTFILSVSNLKIRSLF